MQGIKLSLTAWWWKPTAATTTTATRFFVGNLPRGLPVCTLNGRRALTHPEWCLGGLDLSPRQTTLLLHRCVPPRTPPPPHPTHTHTHTTKRLFSLHTHTHTSAQTMLYLTIRDSACCRCLGHKIRVNTASIRHILPAYHLLLFIVMIVHPPSHHDLPCTCILLNDNVQE